MKITSSAEDDVIKSIINMATTFGEKYTGRDFRANTWTLLLDCFGARIELRRDPVATITFVKHLVSDSQVTVATSVYYLKKGVQSSEILLQDGQDWPTDTDEREQAIEIEFVTEAYRCIDQIKEAMLRHIAYLYTNRGDCDTKNAAIESGASFIYDQFRIARV